jgi:hypothetical protein
VGQAVVPAAAGVAGLGQVPVTAFRGDASWIGYPMVHGHWYTGPGQVDVPLGFLDAAGTKIGDTITISYAGHRIQARIAGDVFDPDNNGIVILTGWQTLGPPGSRWPRPCAPNDALRRGQLIRSTPGQRLDSDLYVLCGLGVLIGTATSKPGSFGKKNLGSLLLTTRGSPSPPGRSPLTGRWALSG